MTKLFIFLITFMTSSAFAVTDVQVFTLSTQMMTGMTYDSQRCNVDDASNLQQELNQQLTTINPHDNTAIQLLVSQYAPELMSAMNCLVLAKQLGITKVPAIVVNHHAVVYGEHDVSTAISIINRYLDGHQS